MGKAKVRNRRLRTTSSLILSGGMTALTLTTLTILSLVSGCTKPDLNRSTAKTLIEKRFSPAQCAFRIPREVGATRVPPVLEAGFREGFWYEFWGWAPRSPGGVPLGWIVDRVQLTPKGMTVFASLGFVDGDAQVTLRAPIQRRVEEVTGIRDDPSGPPGTAKLVTFTWSWNWDAVPDEVKRVVRQAPPVAQAAVLIRLYDDGWRVEGVVPCVFRSS